MRPAAHPQGEMIVVKIGPAVAPTQPTDLIVVLEKRTHFVQVASGSGYIPPRRIGVLLGHSLLPVGGSIGDVVGPFSLSMSIVICLSLGKTFWSVGKVSSAAARPIVAGTAQAKSVVRAIWVTHSHLH